MSLLVIAGYHRNEGGYSVRVTLPINIIIIANSLHVCVNYIQLTNTPCDISGLE